MATKAEINVVNLCAINIQTERVVMTLGKTFCFFFFFPVSLNKNNWSHGHVEGWIMHPVASCYRKVFQLQKKRFSVHEFNLYKSILLQWELKWAPFPSLNNVVQRVYCFWVGKSHCTWGRGLFQEFPSAITEMESVPRLFSWRRL